jgi:hypothetical protein
VAVLISLGRDWLPGALGIRLGHVLLGTATVAGLYLLLGRPRGRDLGLAAALIFAQPLLQVYAFIATPDGPLLFCTVLYLLAYRHYLRVPTPGRGLLWGVTMAGLLYSKYQGVVLILFTVLPVLFRLIRQPGAWVAALSGFLLFVPHLYWQWVHDFPSFRYHLVGRNDPYRIGHTLGYIRDQLLVFSPFLLYHYARSLALSWPRAAFSRYCRWLIIGVLLFFLYATSRGRTEAHWTALLSVPLVYLLYRTVTERFPHWREAVLRLSVVSGLILLIARVLLVAPREWLPFTKPFDHAPWVAELADPAGDRPVVFQNSYRLASLYRFYSGRAGWTFTDVGYRLNQYDLREGGRRFHGDTILLAGQPTWGATGTRTFRAGRSLLRLREVPDFQMAAPVSITATVAAPGTVRPGSSVEASLRAASPHTLHLRSRLPLFLYAILRYDDGRLRYWKLSGSVTERLPGRDTVALYRGPVTVPPSAPPGEVGLEFGLGYQGMPPLLGQSNKSELTIGAK